MKLIVSLVTLCFANSMFAQEIKLSQIFDFSSLVSTTQDCDLRVSALVSLINCGGTITSFDTIAAFKRQELKNVQTHAGKASFINR